jgi:hypothetical protein
MRIVHDFQKLWAPEHPCYPSVVVELTDLTGASCDRPIKARSDDVPPTRIADTMVVIIPRGAVAKMTMSIFVKHSLIYCFVGASPNREINGVRSVARLLAKLSHHPLMVIAWQEPVKAGEQ